MIVKRIQKHLCQAETDALKKLRAPCADFSDEHSSYTLIKKILAYSSRSTPEVHRFQFLLCAFSANNLVSADFMEHIAHELHTVHLFAMSLTQVCADQHDFFIDYTHTVMDQLGFYSIRPQPCQTRSGDLLLFVYIKQTEAILNVSFASTTSSDAEAVATRFCIGLTPVCIVAANLFDSPNPSHSEVDKALRTQKFALIISKLCFDNTAETTMAKVMEYPLVFLLNCKDYSSEPDRCDFPGFSELALIDAIQRKHYVTHYNMLQPFLGSMAVTKADKRVETKVCTLEYARLELNLPVLKPQKYASLCETMQSVTQSHLKGTSATSRHSLFKISPEYIDLKSLKPFSVQKLTLTLKSTSGYPALYNCMCFSPRTRQPIPIHMHSVLYSRPTLCGERADTASQRSRGDAPSFLSSQFAVAQDGSPTRKNKFANRARKTILHLYKGRKKNKHHDNSDSRTIVTAPSFCGDQSDDSMKEFLHRSNHFVNSRHTKQQYCSSMRATPPDMARTESNPSKSQQSFFPAHPRSPETKFSETAPFATPSTHDISSTSGSELANTSPGKAAPEFDLMRWIFVSQPEGIIQPKDKVSIDLYFCIKVPLLTRQVVSTALIFDLEPFQQSIFVCIDATVHPSIVGLSLTQLNALELEPFSKWRDKQQFSLSDESPRTSTKLPIPKEYWFLLDQIDQSYVPGALVQFLTQKLQRPAFGLHSITIEPHFQHVIQALECCQSLARFSFAVCLEVFVFLASHLPISLIPRELLVDLNEHEDDQHLICRAILLSLPELSRNLLMALMILMRSLIVEESKQKTLIPTLEAKHQLTEAVVLWLARTISKDQLDHSNVVSLLRHFLVTND